MSRSRVLFADLSSGLNRRGKVSLFERFLAIVMAGLTAVFGLGAVIGLMSLPGENAMHFWYTTALGAITFLCGSLACSIWCGHGVPVWIRRLFLIFLLGIQLVATWQGIQGGPEGYPIALLAIGSLFLSGQTVIVALWSEKGSVDSLQSG